MNELKKMLNDNNYLMSSIVSGSQEQPERLIRATTSVPELESLTMTDLNAVARSYLKSEDGLPLVIVPKQTVGKQSGAQPAAREPALEYTSSPDSPLLLSLLPDHYVVTPPRAGGERRGGAKRRGGSRAEWLASSRALTQG